MSPFMSRNEGVSGRKTASEINAVVNPAIINKKNTF
jgi:hypothetical protein